ncbi:DUF445 family protein [Calditerrivibrio sp.]|uniref:DUF445 family protein n=1 Tax=Calditerrivibrio sp. TaxID=2792612 RepID=UPI003D13F0E1
MQLHYSLILTPFLTGFVGYFTNYLAIKMLFRPHKKSWYSFGWQGVIPRNRSKLAKEIGKLVGNELIKEDDIIKSIKDEQFQALLSDFIRKELKRLLNSEGNIYLNDILKKLNLPVEELIKITLDVIIKNEEFKSKFNEVLKDLIDLISDFLGKRKIGDLKIDINEIYSRIYVNAIENGSWQQIVVSSLKEKLYDWLYSGKKIKEILPDSLNDKIYELSPILAEKLINQVRQLFNDPIFKIKITRKIIDWKNNYFGDSFFDQLKLGVLNAFLGDDKIAELVDNELPKILNTISEDKSTFENIKGMISNQFNILLDKQVSHFVDFLGVENVHSFINRIMVSFEWYLRSEAFGETIFNFLKNLMEQNGQKSFNEVLTLLDIDIKNFLGKLLSYSTIIERRDVIEKILVDLISGINISLMFRSMTENSYENIAEKIRSEINLLLDRNIPNVIRSLNIPKIVEDRINTLNLYQVEGLLFSFMSDQFKWINILGFILGFIFGMMQSVFVIIYGGIV